MNGSERMLTFGEDGARFTVRVAGACLHRGHVLLHRAIESDFWVLPGGRVHHGEETVIALARELAEELPIPPTVRRLLWVAENFYTFFGTRYHEIGFYYLFTLPPTSPWLDTTGEFLGREGDVDLVFRWFPVDALPDLPLYPRFLRDSLRRIPSRTNRVVQYDDETTSAHPTAG